MSEQKPAIALWFRYGPAEHSELFHAMPYLVEALAQNCEVHYYGMKSGRTVPARIGEHAQLHWLPFTVNRRSTRDKIIKLVLWYLALPFIGLACRLRGMQAVYIDDYVPLSSWIARIFYGPRVAYMVADFHHEDYAEKVPILKPLAALVSCLDLACWKRLPLIFTHVKSTRRYLVNKGVPPDHVVPVYDPCDFNLYHPVDRDQARKQFGYEDHEVVLVHHGILHPSKGLDVVIRWLAPHFKQQSQLRLLLVGSGPEEENLKKLCRELGLTAAVQFTGWLDEPSDVNVGLNAGDIGLVVRRGSASDHFHVTGSLVHSMAVGLPVLATDLEGIAEIITDGENGSLFDAEDREAFDRKLLELVNEPERRQRYGERVARQARELFDMESIVAGFNGPLTQLAHGEWP